MSRSARNSLGTSNTVLAIHRQGDSLRLLTARADGASVAVKEATTLPAADRAGLLAAIGRLRPDRVVHVIPSGQTIWRRLDAAPPAQDTPPAQVEAAMGLLAEASLPATVPPHRRAAAAFRTPGGVACIACAWVGEHTDGELEVPEQWLPEPAAILSAARLLGRGPGLCIYADRTAGVVTIGAVAGGEKPSTVIRVSREDGADAAAWRQAVESLAAECGASSALTVPRLETEGDCTLVLPPAEGEPPVLSGVPTSDRRWLNQFALALGAAALALTATPAERPLLAMHAQAPEYVEPIYLRAATRLASAKKLAVVVAACVVLCLAVPLGMAYARLSILQGKSSGAKAGSDEFQKAVDQAEWYQLLREKRWPMTRLLAEITTSAPEGVLIDDVTIEHGKTISVTATAESAEVVSAWREAINKGKVFEDAKVPSIDSSSTPVRFSLSAKVAAPMLAMADAVPAPGTKIDVPTPEPLPVLTSSGSGRNGDRTDRTSDRTNRNTGRNSRSNSGGGSGSGSTTSAEKPAAAAPPPAALSEAQINKLDQLSAARELGSRLRASKQAGVSEDDKRRLESEVTAIRARMAQLQGGGQ